MTANADFRTSIDGWLPHGESLIKAVKAYTKRNEDATSSTVLGGRLARRRGRTVKRYKTERPSRYKSCKFTELIVVKSRAGHGGAVSRDWSKGKKSIEVGERLEEVRRVDGAAMPVERIAVSSNVETKENTELFGEML